MLGHEMAKSKKAAAEPIGVGFKAPDELTLPISSKPDSRLIVLVRILARQAARDFVQAACDGQERNSRHLNISEKQQVSMESARPINRHLRRDACTPPLDDEDDQICASTIRKTMHSSGPLLPLHKGMRNRRRFRAVIVPTAIGC